MFLPISTIFVAVSRFGSFGLGVIIGGVVINGLNIGGLNIDGVVINIGGGVTDGLNIGGGVVIVGSLLRFQSAELQKRDFEFLRLRGGRQNRFGLFRGAPEELRSALLGATFS